MRRPTLITLGAAAVLSALTLLAQQRAVVTPPPSAKKPVIQMAILLDTSSSMDGLIDQARTQLWKVVNEFATSKRDGKNPELQVALYEYGNDGLPSEGGWIRKILPFTTDLDKLSEELFALKTNGGTEHCGQVIGKAVKELAWNASNDDLKVIFIAGNEPFTQGAVDFKATCKAAITKGIVVNTIFCGEKQEGIEGQWKAGAELADGRYMTIDQNYKPPEISAPQDTEITRLGGELNKTYLAFGAAGKAGSARQEAQDTNALAAAPSVAAQRQVAKAQAVYSNATWDLVDAKKDGTLDLDKVDVKDLPPEMQKMTPAERKAYVEQKAKERAEIQAKIQKLDDERKKFVAEEMKKQAQTGANTLDAAVVSAVREQGKKKGYQFN